MPLAVAALLLAVAASAAGGPTIEAAGGGGYAFYWSPSSAEVGTGGSVTFKNSSASVPHGVEWTGTPPATPSCSGVPIGEGRTSWSGSCTFAQPGTYTFRCVVHPTEMTGAITVSASGTVTTSPSPPSESPLSGPAAQALKLASSQRGSVRGSIAVSQAGAGARLEVDLLARRAALLGAGHTGRQRVGRLIRSALQPGRISFTVPLGRPARRTLRRHGRLSLRVEVIVTPQHGPAVKLKRGVLLHA